MTATLGAVTMEEPISAGAVIELPALPNPIGESDSADNVIGLTEREGEASSIEPEVSRWPAPASLSAGNESAESIVDSTVVQTAAPIDCAVPRADGSGADSCPSALVGLSRLLRVIAGRTVPSREDEERIPGSLAWLTAADTFELDASAMPAIAAPMADMTKQPTLLQDASDAVSSISRLVVVLVRIADVSSLLDELLVGGAGVGEVWEGLVLNRVVDVGVGEERAF